MLSGRKQHGRFTGAGVAGNALDARGFPAASRSVGQLLLDLARRGARPEAADHHQLEGERRVFGLAQTTVSNNAHQRDGKQEIADQRAVMQRPVGEVETMAHDSALPVGGVARRVCTASPSTRRPAPVTTMTAGLQAAGYLGAILAELGDVTGRLATLPSLYNAQPAARDRHRSPRSGHQQLLAGRGIEQHAGGHAEARLAGHR